MLSLAALSPRIGFIATLDQQRRLFPRLFCEMFLIDDASMMGLQYACGYDIEQVKDYLPAPFDGINDSINTMTPPPCACTIVKKLLLLRRRQPPPPPPAFITAFLPPSGRTSSPPPLSPSLMHCP